jgi:DNA-binding GntR family transcriptional regulator
VDGDSDPIRHVFGGAALYQRIAADLRARITSGALRSGATLPSYDSLAASYRCSAATAQKAVSSLRSEGFVASAAGRGTYVISTAPHQDGPVRLLHELHAELHALSLHTSKAQAVVDATFIHHGRRHLT